MNTTVSTADRVQIRSEVPMVRHSDQAHQAYAILRFGFTVLPIVAGLDKFFHKLTNWDMYLSPIATNFATQIGLTAHAFMQAVGVIEIVAGLLVAFVPRFGAYLVAVWLAGIIANLLLLPGYYDVALRDFGLFLGANALGKLSHKY